MTIIIRISFENIVSLPLTMNHMLLKEKLKIKGKKTVFVLCQVRTMFVADNLPSSNYESCAVKTVISQTFPRNIVNLCLCVQ